MAYKDRIAKLLRPAEIRLFRRLNTPQKVQDYLDSLPINFELHGETYMSPRRLISARRAHCLEGALFAAAVQAFHGQKPLLLDFMTTDEDEDHVVAPFVQNGRWGAISKTNHAILRYRDPVYESPRELAMSYFNEYFINSGKKTLRSFSGPVDMSRFAPEKWVTAEKDLYWVVDLLNRVKHFPVAPKKNLRLVRKASGVERTMVRLEEWNKRGKKN